MTSPLVIPELAAVYDAASNRELLFAPQPLEVQVAAKSQVAILRLQNF